MFRFQGLEHRHLWGAIAVKKEKVKESLLKEVTFDLGSKGQTEILKVNMRERSVARRGRERRGDVRERRGDVRKRRET